VFGRITRRALAVFTTKNQKCTHFVTMQTKNEMRQKKQNTAARMHGSTEKTN